MKKRTYISLLLIFALGFCIAAWKIVFYYHEERAADNLYAGLLQQVTIVPETAPTEATQNESEEPGEKPVLPEYELLHLENPDLVGWITIEGAEISYPVVQSTWEPNFYLTHDFNGEESKYGCPYVQENCDVFAPSDNVIIYGHHVRSGTMFSELLRYREESFWKENPTFRFDTLTDRCEYEVMAVVSTRADESGIAYRSFVNAADETEFAAFVDRCKTHARYDTGVTAAYGDHLLTLSTCESNQDPDTRLIVVARRIEQ